MAPVLQSQSVVPRASLWKRLKLFFMRNNTQNTLKDFLIDMANSLVGMYTGFYIGLVAASNYFNQILSLDSTGDLHSNAMPRLFPKSLSAFFPFLHSWELKCIENMGYYRNIHQHLHRMPVIRESDRQRWLLSRDNLFVGSKISTNEDERQPWNDFDPPPGELGLGDPHSNETCPICTNPLYDVMNPHRKHYILNCCHQKIHVDCANKHWKSQRRHVNEVSNLGDPLPMTCPFCIREVGGLSGGPLLFPLIFPDTDMYNKYKTRLQ